MLITKPHVALLASPGIGHLIPVLELGERLVAQHGFQATVIVVATDAFTSRSLLNSTQPNLDIITLPILDISGLVDRSASIITKLAVLMRQSLPILRSTISGMKFRPTVLVVDIFGTEALAIAEEFDMLRYVFVTSNAWFLAVITYFPTIDQEVEDEHICEKQPLKIPGCKSVRFDTFEPYLDRSDQVYVEFKRLGMEIPMADGILVNTWEDLEANTLAALRNNNMLGHVSEVNALEMLLESITNGVPMVAWPLYAEQKLNAILLAEEGNAAIKATLSPSENVLEREEIKTVVCKIMEGKEGIEIRKRVKELEYSGRQALSENGSSYESLTQVTKECEIRLRDIKAKAHGA